MRWVTIIGSASFLGTPWIDEFRRLFGDERTDYSESTKRNYAESPPVDWHLRFISSYASSHPWEDWAETWAHILLMADTLATAMSFGLDPQLLDLEIEPFPADALYQPDEPFADGFLTFLNSRIALSAVMHEMSGGMGLTDFYPFRSAASGRVKDALYLCRRSAGAQKAAEKSLKTSAGPVEEASLSPV